MAETEETGHLSDKLAVTEDGLGHAPALALVDATSGAASCYAASCQQGQVHCLWVEYIPNSLTILASMLQVEEGLVQVDGCVTRGRRVIDVTEDEGENSTHGCWE